MKRSERGANGLISLIVVTSYAISFGFNKSEHNLIEEKKNASLNHQNTFSESNESYEK